MSLFYNALWILGLAIILAAFSYFSWQANEQGNHLRQVLNGPGFQLWLVIGLLLVSLSLLLLANIWWERLIWFVFSGLFGHQLWQAYKSSG